MALQNLRSSTADKRPTVSSMSDGQIALNTNSTSPGVFFKDSGGSLIKVGPVHIGTTAPNSSPAGSTGNAVGEQWLDTTGGGYVFKIWDGTAWRSESGTFVDTSGDTMTGALILPSGTAAAPALGVGSADNGLYSSGTDEVSVSTNGTQRVVVDSSGNVGIGTSSPFYKLHVVSTGSDIAQLQSSNAFNAFLKFQGNDTTQAPEIGGAGDNIVIRTAFTERVRVGSGGNVGIGTSSPAGKLHVRSSSTGASPWANADDLVVENNGPAGISILAPNNNQCQIIFGTPSDNIGSIFRWNQSDNELQLGTHSTDGFLTFKTAIGQERMRIGSAGQIGLGGANYGTSGQVLTSNGSSSAPTWQDAGGGGGGAWTLLSTTTVSSAVASVDITSNIDNTYKKYVVDFFGLENDSTFSRELRLRVYNNGSIISTSSSYSHITMRGIQNNVSSATLNNTDFLRLQATGVSQDNRESTGIFYMYEPGVTSKTEYFFRWECGSADRIGITVGNGCCFSSSLSSSTSLDGVQFFFNGANITSGTFKLYGIS